MGKGTLAAFILFFSIMQANAQLGLMKMVGKNTNNYTWGFGAFIKTGYPVSEGRVSSGFSYTDLMPNS
jgi:hypothetical protein